MKSRIFATLAIVTTLAIGVSTPAFASQSYTGALSVNSAGPGGSVHYSADKTGQPDGTPGDYTLTDTHTGALGAPVVNEAAVVTHSVRVGSHTQLAFSFRLPTNAKPGSTYTLNVKAGTFTDSQTIKIVGVAASAAAANLTPLWIVLALVILIVLAFVFLIARRRRTSAAGTTTVA